MSQPKSRLVLIGLGLFFAGYLTGFWLGYTVCPSSDLFELETFPAR